MRVPSFVLSRVISGFDQEKRMGLQKMRFHRDEVVEWTR